MKQSLFNECIQNFLLYECFAMHMMTCQVLMLGQNTRGVTPISDLDSDHNEDQKRLVTSQSARCIPAIYVMDLQFKFGICDWTIM